MNNLKNARPRSLKRLELSNTPTLVISKNLQKQIDYLHQKVGNKEWSGELITREEGTINSLDNWKIIAEDIYLANIGTGAYTEYTVDSAGFTAPDIVAMYEKFPDLLEGKIKAQHIHTHRQSCAL